MPTLCSVLTNKSRHQAKLEIWSERPAMCSGWKYYFAFWISFSKQSSFIIYQREIGHMLRFRFLFRFWNFLLKKNFPKAFLFWAICELWRVFILIVLCIATLETSSFWTSSHPLASSTRSTTWRLVSLSKSLIPNLQEKKGISWLFRCAKTTSGWWLLQSVEQLGCRWYPSLF